MNGAAAVAEILKREGVEFLIAYPVNSVIEAAARADIRTIIVRQERTGIHMADAFSRLNSGRKIGVFAMQVGPGVENSFGGSPRRMATRSPFSSTKAPRRGHYSPSISDPTAPCSPISPIGAIGTPASWAMSTARDRGSPSAASPIW